MSLSRMKLSKLSNWDKDYFEIADSCAECHMTKRGFKTLILMYTPCCGKSMFLLAYLLLFFWKKRCSSCVFGFFKSKIHNKPLYNCIECNRELKRPDFSYEPLFRQKYYAEIQKRKLLNDMFFQKTFFVNI